jgi:hypothetical protein
MHRVSAKAHIREIYVLNNEDDTMNTLEQRIAAIKTDRQAVIQIVSEAVFDAEGVTNAPQLADRIMDLLRGGYESRHPSDMVLHPLSEIREWDEALAVLGIQDSDQTPADAIRERDAEIEEAGKAAISLRNELDRMTADRNYHADLAESWKAQFHSAAAAASEYSEFWEKHHGDFDQFGNYLPYSQIDGDLRAAKAKLHDIIEKCAKIAENRAWMGKPYPGNDIAAAIRALVGTGSKT